MIKVGLVGIGGIGKVHFDAYKNIDDAKIVCVADVRYDMAKEKLCGEENINIYRTMEEMLEKEDIDMVDICTPSYMHAKMSIDALKKGVNVLCEKPMSISSEDTSLMKEVAEKSGKFLMIAHVLRFMYPYKYLKSVIDSKELGKLLHIDMKRISSIPTWSWEDWMRDVSKSGGTPFDLSIHDIDFAQYVFGMPKKVSGVYRKLRENSDYVVSELVYDDFDVTISAAWYNYTIDFKEEYLAVFENGYVENVGGKIIKNGEEVKFDVESTASDTDINIKAGNGYEDEIRYFVNCIKNNTKPDMVSVESSQQSVSLVEKILENSVII